ncbi:unnamed protein product [Gadus morhua 'NCC']
MLTSQGGQGSFRRGRRKARRRRAAEDGVPERRSRGPLQQSLVGAPIEVIPDHNPSFVALLRKQKVGAGSKMEALQKYVLARDAGPKAAPEPVHALPRPGVSYSDPTDAQLLAAADEVDPPSTSRDAPPAAVQLEGPAPGPGPMAQRPATGKELLPLSWRQTLPEKQQQWVGRALFRRDPSSGKVVLVTPPRLWWYPPDARLLYTRNENHGRAAVEGGPRATLRCYSARLQHSFNQLARELLGVEVLYSQSGSVLQPDPNAPEGTDEQEEDDGGGGEGFEEQEEPEEIRLLEHHSALLQEPLGMREVDASMGSSRPPPDDDRMEVQQAEQEEEECVVLSFQGHVVEPTPLQPPLQPLPWLEPCPAPLPGGTGSRQRRSVVGYPRPSL